MTRDAQSQGHGRVDNCIHRLGYIGGEDLWSGDLFISPMCGQPDFSERALLSEDDLGVEHDLEIEIDVGEDVYNEFRWWLLRG